MSPFTIVILICSLSVDHAACQPDTAIDIVQGPKVTNEHDCGFFGQTTIAATAITPRPGEEYMKVVCTRHGDIIEYHKRAEDGSERGRLQLRVDGIGG